MQDLWRRRLAALGTHRIPLWCAERGVLPPLLVRASRTPDHLEFRADLRWTPLAASLPV